MNKHDVIIVGAGPAGCAAAIFCARQGLSVALLEQWAVCRDRPGETLPPGIEPLLQQLGAPDRLLSQDFIRHTGNWVQWGAARHFNRFGADADGPWRGFQIPRCLFDESLIVYAQSLGVYVARPCRVARVIVQDNAVSGVDTDNGAFHGAYILDASGATAWLARQLALQCRAYSPRLLAAYGYAKGAFAVCDDAPSIIADDNGWYWIAKIGADAYAWTRLSFCSDSSLNRAPPHEFEHLRDFSRARGAEVTWRACDQCAGPGYFMLGDAASVLDPGTSHGVLKAIMSGMMAAHAVVESLAHPLQIDTIQFQYRAWLNDWFARDVRKMRELYASHPTPPHWLAGLDLNNSF